MKRMMIESALSEGGVPPIGYESLDECFTTEPELGIVLLWYNVADTTKVVVRDIAEASAAVRIAG
jgi:hypothetical protein